MSTGPYREEPSGARYVCLVCFRHASVARGLCPKCEVDLLPLENADVREELRAEAERRMQGRMYGEYFGVSLAGFLVGLPALLLAGELVYIGVAMGIGWLGTRAYARLRPRSALALYAARKQRLELGQTAKVRGLPAPGQSTVDAADPEDLDLAATLRWLGVRVD